MKKIATLFAIGLLLAACGDDDDPENEDSTVTTCEGRDICPATARGEYHSQPGLMEEDAGSWFTVIVDGKTCLIFSRGEGETRALAMDCDWSE